MARENLWAPWRMEYVGGLAEDPADAGDCFLCEAWSDPSRDAERGVIHRTDSGIIIINRYPYTNGHLLAALGDHLADLDQIAPAARAELMELCALGHRLLVAAVNPHGANIGINLGRCAGAGVPGHLHMHIVPRWSGDTNFMDVVGEVNVIPQAMRAAYDQLVAVLPKVLADSP